MRAALAFGALVAAGVVACGTATSPRPTITVGSAIPATASLVPATLPPRSGPPASAAIAVDPSLLDLLPDEVGSVAVEFSGEASTEQAANPLLARDAEALAYGIAARPSSDDIVVAALVRLKPDVFDPDWFRDWRDSYDAAVCEQAGGVAGNAEAPIGGRQVFIGSCANGGHTYHVWLDRQRVVVSAFSVGEARLGEELMETLEPPAAP